MLELKNNMNHSEENISDQNDYEELPEGSFDFVQLDEAIHDQKFETEAVGYFRDAMRRFMRSKSAVVAFIIIAIIVIMGFVGPLISNYTYREQTPTAARLPPRIPWLENFGIFDGSVEMRVQTANIPINFADSYISTIREHEIMGVPMSDIKVNAYVLSGVEDLYFWFGTDTLGRCIWTRTWQGVYISLIIAVGSSFINLLIGLFLGALAGYYGGWVDMILFRISEIIGAIPSIVIVMVLVIYVGAASLWTLMAAFILAGWIFFFRITRIQIYRYKNREFVLASSTMGASDWRLIMKHIFPSAVGTLITLFALTIPQTIMIESGLTFLGLGLSPPTPSIGIMLMDGQSHLTTFPYRIVPPAIIISALMICFNLFGNGLRDAFDPSLRGTTEDA